MARDNSSDCNDNAAQPPGKEGSMTMTVSQFRDEWADREAIRDCLWRYARGIDRSDEAMLRSAYWPDATDDHGGLFSGSATDFIDRAAKNFPNRDRTTMHLISNMIIRLDGSRAKAESYVYAIESSPNAEGQMRDIVCAARYLDHFERRGDEWRIAQRTVAIDWFREYPDAPDWVVGPFGLGETSRGGPKPEDKSYCWLGLA
jgi:hypothetical protein